MSIPCDEPITILIADDHPVYRSGLRMLLETMPPLRVVGEASSGADAMTMTRELRPQLVLMDVNLPDFTGVEATRMLVNKHPTIGVIIVTMFADKDTFLSAIRAGARGFLQKGAGSDEVSHAINVVHSGGLAFDSRSSQWVIDHLTKPSTVTRPFPELTDREHEILELIADGLGNAAIARQLSLSVKTVRNYVSRITGQLRVDDRAEAVVLARRAGLGRLARPACAFYLYFTKWFLGCRRLGLMTRLGLMWLNAATSLTPRREAAVPALVPPVPPSLGPFPDDTGPMVATLGLIG